MPEYNFYANKDYIIKYLTQFKDVIYEYLFENVQRSVW